MNSEKIIKLNIEALYSSVVSIDIFANYFYKFILHNTVIIEIFFTNKKIEISYKKLCSNIPNLISSRQSVQRLFNEGLTKKLFKKVDDK